MPTCWPYCLLETRRYHSFPFCVEQALLAALLRQKRRSERTSKAEKEKYSSWRDAAGDKHIQTRERSRLPERCQLLHHATAQLNMGSKLTLTAGCSMKRIRLLTCEKKSEAWHYVRAFGANVQMFLLKVKLHAPVVPHCPLCRRCAAFPSACAPECLTSE